MTDHIITIDRGSRAGLARASCSCGWEGPQRARATKVQDDIDGHSTAVAPPVPDRLTPAQRATVEQVRADGKAGIYYGPDALLAVLDEIAPRPEVKS